MVLVMFLSLFFLSWEAATRKWCLFWRKIKALRAQRLKKIQVSIENFNWDLKFSIPDLQNSPQKNRGLVGGSQTKIYPVQNWSVKKPIGSFFQTTAPVLDKIYELMGGWFLSSTGLGSGTVIGGREFLSAPSLDKIISLIFVIVFSFVGGSYKKMMSFLEKD